MVVGDGGFAGFGGGCWLCGFARERERERERERDLMFILLEWVVYIILMNCMFPQKKEKKKKKRKELYVKIKKWILGEL